MSGAKGLKRTLLLAVVVAVCTKMVLSGISVAQDRAATANRLATEAAILLDKSRGERGGVRLDLLKQVQSRLRQIIQEYPDTDLAVRLATGQSVGILKVDEVEAQIGPLEQRQLKEQCGRQPTKECLADLAFRFLKVVGLKDGNARPYLDVIAALMTVERRTDAIWIAEHLDVPQYQGLAYATIASASKKRADVEASENYFSGTRRDHTTVEAYALLAGAINDVRLSLSIARDLPRWFNWSDKRTLAATANVLAENAHEDALLELVRELGRNQAAAYAWSVLSSRSYGKEVDAAILAHARTCSEKGECVLAMARFARRTEAWSLADEVEALSIALGFNYSAALALAEISFVGKREQRIEAALRITEKVSFDYYDTMVRLGLVLDRSELVSQAVSKLLEREPAADARWYVFQELATIARVMAEQK